MKYLMNAVLIISLFFSSFIYCDTSSVKTVSSSETHQVKPKIKKAKKVKTTKKVTKKTSTNKSCAAKLPLRCITQTECLQRGPGYVWVINQKHPQGICMHKSRSSGPSPVKSNIQTSTSVNTTNVVSSVPASNLAVTTTK